VAVPLKLVEEGLGRCIEGEGRRIGFERGQVAVDVPTPGMLWSRPASDSAASSDGDIASSAVAAWRKARTL
jgi:hypothetical protein